MFRGSLDLTGAAKRSSLHEPKSKSLAQARESVSSTLLKHSHDYPVGGFLTPLKNIRQNGNLPQIGVKIKNILKPPSSYPFHQHLTVTCVFLLVT